MTLLTVILIMENTTTVDGNGRNPGEKEILAVGVSAGMEKRNVKEL